MKDVLPTGKLGKVYFLLDAFPALGGVETVVENNCVNLNQQGIPSEVLASFNGGGFTSHNKITYFNPLQRIIVKPLLLGDSSARNILKNLPFLVIKKLGLVQTLQRITQRFFIYRLTHKISDRDVLVVCRSDIFHELRKNSVFRNRAHLTLGQYHTSITPPGPTAGLFTSDDLTSTDYQGFLVLSERDRDYLVQLTQKPVRFFPNFTTVGSFKPSTHEKRVTVISRHVTSKRVDKAIEIFSQVATQENSLEDWYLDIYGDGPEHLTLRQLAASLPQNISARIYFHGVKPPQEAFKKSSLLVSLSELEGWHMVIAEAAAASVTSLAMDVSGGVQTLSKATEGTLIPANDFEGFRVKLKDLLTHHDRLIEAGHKSRIGIETYDSSRIGAILLDSIETFKGAQR